MRHNSTRATGERAHTHREAQECKYFVIGKQKEGEKDVSTDLKALQVRYKS